MSEKSNTVLRVSKRCPYCNKRLLDKVSVTSGIIEIKCPECHNTVKINLSYRISLRGSALRYRLASSL